MFVWKEGDTPQCVEVREHVVAVDFLLPQCGSGDWSLGFQAWLRVLFSLNHPPGPCWWAPTSVWWNFFYTLRKVLHERENNHPLLGNVMKKLECLQLTAFYRLWISKHRMKWKRINICFAVEIFALWGIHWHHSHLFCRKRMLGDAVGLKYDLPLPPFRSHY